MQKIIAKCSYDAYWKKAMHGVFTSMRG
jgi:hypothetical protein